MQTSQLDQLLKFLTETLQQGKDFTIEQAPQFVRELLMWRYYEAVFFIGVGVGAILVGWLLHFAIKKSGDEDFRWLGSVGGTGIGAIVIAVNLHTAIQVKVAPRVVLVEMVRNLVAGQR